MHFKGHAKNKYIEYKQRLRIYIISLYNAYIIIKGAYRGPEM